MQTMRGLPVRQVLAWVLLALAGVLVLVRLDIAWRREAFQADAALAHRLLSQRMAQLDATLATLALLGPASPGGDAAEQRLPATQSHILTVWRREANQAWAVPGLDAAEQRSRSSRHAELVALDAAALQYTLVQAGAPASFAVRVDMRRLVPWDEWPIARDGPVQVSLIWAGQTLALQPGQPAADRPFGLTQGFVFAKALSTPGQAFELRLQRATGPSQWPWAWLALWLANCVGVAWAWQAWQQGVRARRRAEDMLRVGRVARLNTLGELAAGLAHELNQPLTAVMANAQAARRLLDDDPPELDTARQALVQVATQARRAADVVGRIRRLVASPELAPAPQPVAVDELLRQVIELCRPDAQRQGISLTLIPGMVSVLADPVALEQIIFNLISNAMQALDSSPRAGASVVLACRVMGEQAVITVRDNGPGVPPDVLPRLFEPFFTTRSGGLGLGLSLCETLAQAMHGSISVHSSPQAGAEFALTLPLAPTPP